MYVFCLSSTLLLDSMDHIGVATFQIKETLAHVLEDSVIMPQASDTIGIGLQGVDMLGKLNLGNQGTIFTPMVLDKPQAWYSRGYKASDSQIGPDNPSL